MITKELTASQKLSKARAGLILDQPFFGSLALRLKIAEDRSCRTAWTDGKSIGYNPDFIDGLTLDQTKFVLAHEVMHLACSHSTRIKGREPKRFNKAGDYAINPILINSKFVPLDDCLNNPSFHGMAAEQIYNLMPEPEKEQGKNNQDDSQPPGNGGGSDDNNDQSDDKSDDPNDQPDNSNNQNNPQKQEDNDPGGCGEVRQAKFESHAEQQQYEQDWKVAVAQAAQQAKAHGDVPAGLDRFIGDVLKSRVDWREVLRRFVDQSAKNDYSWTRPNRRYLGSGFYLPSLYSEAMGHIVVAVDTSGSIDDDMLTKFAAELTGILQEYKTTCDVIYCDTRIPRNGGHESFSSDDLPIVFHPVGGGGTDFRPPFDWVEEQNMTPVCFIYLTDMCCNDFPVEPGYPVLWAVIGKYGYPAPFGEEVEIEED